MILAVVFGVVIGLSTGLLGAGGSILAVPALVYGVGQPMSTAVPTALVVVAASAIGGLCSRNRLRLVQWPVALVFGLAGIPGAIGGAVLGRSLPQDWLLLGFAVLMVVVAARMFRSGGRGPSSEVDQQGFLPRTAAAGSGVGVLTGLFGVGGGFVVVPALTILLGLTAPQAIANSMVVITINSVSGLVAHTGAAAQLDLGVLLTFAATAMLVSVAAARFSDRLPASTVRRAFAWTVLVIAAGVGTSSAINLATA
ncbi:sulfite exporter TauE/SafE family protein [Saccharopolyspora sp. NPDC000359]|uniref:sulfite exporter TauE/SafE family protein n=1 Tax=Saccharopolyspora sp. NPDC000359 TaxID=3154251 RepID=UPI003320A7E5